MRRPELSSSDTAQTRLLHPSFVRAVMTEQSNKKEAARSGTSETGTRQTKAELPQSWGKLTFIRSRLRALFDPVPTFAVLRRVAWHDV